jgi:hypothetical protein
MAELPKPLNVLELPDGQSVTFRITRYDLGEETIYPAHAPQGKVVKVLRVHVPPEDLPTFPHYWDLTSTRLVAGLLPQLQLTERLVARWTITARGIPPKKYFSVERVPV